MASGKPLKGGGWGAILIPKKVPPPPPVTSKPGSDTGVLLEQSQLGVYFSVYHNVPGVYFSVYHNVPGVYFSVYHNVPGVYFSVYHNVLRKVIQQERHIQATKMADNLDGRHYKDLCANIKKIKGNKVNFPATIDSAGDVESTGSLFHNI